MRSDKKGIAIGTLAIIVLGMFSLILMLLFFKYWQKGTTELTIEEKCHDSVILQAGTKISGYTQCTDVLCREQYSDLECETQYLTVEGDEQAIKHQIADLMARCWWMYGKGELEIFNKEAENFCAVCYVLDFKEKTEVDGMLEYLVNTDMPPPSKEKYFEYLTPWEVTNEVFEQSKDILQDRFSTDSRMAVIFKDAKGTHWNGWFIARDVVGGFIGGAIAATGIPIHPYAFVVGIAAGGIGGSWTAYHTANAAEWQTAILLWPYEEGSLQDAGCTNLPVK